MHYMGQFLSAALQLADPIAIMSQAHERGVLDQATFSSRLSNFMLRLLDEPAQLCQTAPAALVRAAHVPFGMHCGLSAAHAGMYGLMLIWGRGLLFGPPAPSDGVHDKAG